MTKKTRKQEYSRNKGDGRGKQRDLPGDVEQEGSSLRNPVRLDITNVAHWFYEVNTQEWYDLSTDFPCLACPWPVAVISFTMPRYSNNNGELIPNPVGTQIIATIETTDMGDDWRSTYQKMRRTEQSEAIYKMLEEGSEEPRWKQVWMVEIKLARYAAEPFGGLVLYLSKDGRPTTSSIPLLYASPRADFQDDNHAVGVLSSLSYPFAFALSLLHCRNVDLKDRPVSRQQRRLSERSGKPVIRYKELVLDAFRSQVRRETAASGEGQIARAMHICRGHFATYDDSAPLFGRVTGTFWRPMHVRGRKDAGEVRKTYKMKSEEGDET